jgi:light-regulated signal transduction histidine kinase (bacteriophytochrome)
VVRDNGIGIHQKDLPHIFERFNQADTPRAKKYGGTGIGLFLARLSKKSPSYKIFHRGKTLLWYTRAIAGTKPLQQTRRGYGEVQIVQLFPNRDGTHFP